MVGNFVDEIDCGNFFDQIDDLLDFPSEDIDAGLPNGNCDSFPTIWTTQSDSLPGSDSVFPGNAAASDLSAELSVPYEDIIQLEWLSNFVEDSFTAGGLTIKKDESSSITKDVKEESSNNIFQTSSPISVLDSSSSCSGGEKSSSTAPHSPEIVTPGRCGRARSKRPRPATFQPRAGFQLMPSAVSPAVQAPKASSDSENFAESRPVIKIPRHIIAEHKKKKKIKLSVPSAPVEGNQNQSSSSAQQPVRKCMHCEITKTPQWRAGPMGPKTLCNACGVRYKSGRLFPEYRPAASPTFIPSLHSNSHKKVVEMRTKNIERFAQIAEVAVHEPASPILIPNNNISADYN